MVILVGSSLSHSLSLSLSLSVPLSLSPTLSLSLSRPRPPPLSPLPPYLSLSLSLSLSLQCVEPAPSVVSGGASSQHALHGNQLHPPAPTSHSGLLPLLPRAQR